MDKQEDIIDQADSIVDTVFDNVNMKELVADPDQTLNILIAKILVEVSKKTVAPMIKESRRFVKSVANQSKKTSNEDA